MADDKNQTHYFLDGNPEELERLRLGQSVINDYVGKLVFAPVDFDRNGLRVLDSATADSQCPHSLLFLICPWRGAFANVKHH